MRMAQMRGEVANAIRASYVDDVKEILANYQKDPQPDYVERIRDERLRDGERLARSIRRRNEQIIAMIQQARATRTQKKARAG